MGGAKDLEGVNAAEWERSPQGVPKYSRAIFSQVSQLSKQNYFLIVPQL
jgi:hypothetical protein